MPDLESIFHSLFEKSPVELMHYPALLSDGKVSAEARGRAFPGVARPWEHCGSTYIDFRKIENFENLENRKF